jgi:methylglutaconyl-CoA hydratase
MEGYVKSHTHNGIATITFFHPQSNSLPSHLLDQLTKEILLAGNDNAVKVIVLQSDGNDVFCAGGSFDEMIAIKDSETGLRFFSGFANVINAIRTAPKFVIVRVQGKVVGGGVGIVSACDYALGIESSSIKLSELAIGIGPFVIGPVVRRKIGVSAFSTLTINATEWKSAKWALEKGLYADIYSTPHELDKAVRTLIEKLSQSNPEAMKMLKKDFWTGTENWDTLLVHQAETVSKLALSNFFINALTQFKNKK